jgi:DnaJ-class molecular chaperone
MADDQQSAEAGGQTCTPCRGTGRLISGLGGEPHQVTCPWCRGTGVRIPGIDAQQSPAEGGGAAGGGPAEAGS